MRPDFNFEKWMPPRNPSPNDSAGEIAQSYRAMLISDLHLGTRGCQAEELVAFLKAYPSDYLYLVGDTVDGWQLRRKWFWPQAHNDVVQKLLRRARKGCRVIYVPSNHDEFARGFLGHQFGDIEANFCNEQTGMTKTLMFCAS